MEKDRRRAQYDTRYIGNRIARTIGHVKRVKSMVESGEDCSDVLIQLAAVRGQLDSICSSIMVQYADQFAEQYRRSGDVQLVERFKAEIARVIRK